MTTLIDPATETPEQRRERDEREARRDPGVYAGCVSWPTCRHCAGPHSSRFCGKRER